jgi:hypothetical protein
LEEVTQNAVLEVPTNTHTITYTELLELGIELGAKCNPATSEKNRLSYRASWLGLLATDGWTEDQWFRASYPGVLSA